MEWAIVLATTALIFALGAFLLAGFALVGRLDLSTRVKDLEEQLPLILTRTEEILRQQAPVLTLAQQLTGALVTVSERRPDGRRGKPVARVQITAARDAVVGSHMDTSQHGGAQFQGDAATQGPVVGGNIDEGTEEG